MHPFALAALLFLASPIAIAAPPDVAHSAAAPPKIIAVDTDGDDITLRFDQPMLTWNEAGTLSAIRLQPQVACQWTWDDDARLRCETGRDVTLRKASTYHLSIGRGLWSQAGVEMPPRELDTTTDLPSLHASIVAWVQGMPRIRITSDLVVADAALAPVVSVTLDGRALPFRIVPYVARNDAAVHAYDLQFVDPPTGAGLLKVHVRPGLASSEGPLRGTQDVDLLAAQINEPFRLREVACGPDYDAKRIAPVAGTPLVLGCNPQRPIALYFSRTPSPEAIAAIRAALPAGLELMPKKDIQEYWSRDFRNGKAPLHAPDAPLYLTTDAAATRLRLALPASLVSVDGLPLAVPVDLALDIGDYPRRLFLKPGVLVVPPGSAELPRIEARNDDAGPHVVRMSIGDDVQLQSSQLAVSGARNVLVSARIPATNPSIREHGGLVLAGARDDRTLGFAVAYAPFNVLVSEGGDELLVWASTWGESRNLAGASVELLSVDGAGHEHVFGRAMTGADGAAVLAVPKELRSHTSETSLLPRMVRVSQQGRRTIVPVLGYAYRVGSLQRYDATHSDNSQFNDGAIRSFGVSDRPLYRPGETVAYRVWLRQRKGNHLLAAGMDQVELDLRSEDQKTLLSWQATLDGQGSLSGEQRLPALLPDNTYCISARERSQETVRYATMQGACFQVARFESQALWAELKTDRTTVLAGHDLGLSLESGYYSGDAAANVAVRFRGTLSPKRFEDAFTEFAAYTFIDSFVDGPDFDPLAGAKPPALTDRDGKAQLTVHLPGAAPVEGVADTSIPFGELRFSAEVSIPGKPSASDRAAPVNFARHARYVGLKTAAWWIPVNQDPKLEAVVVDFEGHAVAGQKVQVAIETGADDPDPGKPKVVGHCELISGQVSPCAFRAPATGRYVFRASAEGAAAAQLTRYFGEAAPEPAESDGAQAGLTLLRASDGSAPARVRLRQPYARANVLFTLEYGAIVSHWVQTVSGVESDIDVPVQAAWAPGVTLHALVRAIDPSIKAASAASHTVDATLDLAIPKPRRDAVTVALDRPRAAPGEDIRLRLGNAAASGRHVTIALVDDSIWQQATDTTAYANPEAAGWLGSLKAWQRTAWYGLEGWTSFANPFYLEPELRKRELPNAVFAGSRNLDRVEVLGTRIKRAVDTEPTSPVTTLTRADIAKNGSGCDTCDVINIIRSSDGSGLATRPSHAGAPSGRMRGAFADSAYWNPDVALAPGETKELTIHLPDNLTRWRVLVWTSDGSDGFALNESTLETALPIELRAGLPGQLFVGDKATASVSARNHGVQAAKVALTVEASGPGVNVRQSREDSVAGNAELSQRIAFAPDAPGEVQVLARAGKSESGDGLSSTVGVLSRMGEEQVTQTGWLDVNTLDLALPPLPVGALSPTLDVQVHRGFDGWRDGWLRDLRDYPHRCWEQTLSRAVGAALAIASGQDKTLWPNAQNEVRDALFVAPGFQDRQGRFRYFVRDPYGDAEGNEALSAYTLRSFVLLHTLGFDASRQTQEDLERAVADILSQLRRDAPKRDDDSRWETAAQAAGALTDPKALDDGALGQLWSRWKDLSWYGRSELVRALIRKPAFAEQAKEGVARLRAAGVQNGLRRVLHDERDFSFFMGSDLRDQCGVVAALYELDTSADGESARRSLLRGLQDLYAGGTASLDTQASAQCLMALHAVARSLPADDTAHSVLLSFGAQQKAMTFAPHVDHAEWSPQLPPQAGNAAGALRLQSQDTADATLNYSARLRYQLDLQQAPPHAVGMRLQRSYQVLRGQNWVPMEKTSLREGDWVRVRLVLDVPALRHFVAITDIVPGGLVSRDITLSHVGGADLERVGSPGSWWFDSRQTGANDVKLYAEQLPSGTHEVYYFAQAVQPGDYFAPPAVAELMYGRASRSTTAPARIVIGAADPKRPR